MYLCRCHTFYLNEVLSCFYFQHLWFSTVIKVNLFPKVELKDTLWVSKACCVWRFTVECGTHPVCLHRENSVHKLYSNLLMECLPVRHSWTSVLSIMSCLYHIVQCLRGAISFTLINLWLFILSFFYMFYYWGVNMHQIAKPTQSTQICWHFPSWSDFNKVFSNYVEIIVLTVF